jgi:hypothetical protein
MEETNETTAKPSSAIDDVFEIPTPDNRPLKCYAFDPSHGKFFGNEMTLRVKYEKLEAGPIGERIAVIDYDGANRKFYKPVNLDDPSLLISSGLNPTESDPRFHQQMVYAVAMETIQNFEAALGRRIRWRLEERFPDANGEIEPGPRDGDIRRLNLYPHAMVTFAPVQWTRAAICPDKQFSLVSRTTSSFMKSRTPSSTVFALTSRTAPVPTLPRFTKRSQTSSRSFVTSHTRKPCSTRFKRQAEGFINFTLNLPLQ